MNPSETETLLGCLQPSAAPIAADAICRAAKRRGLTLSEEDVCQLAKSQTIWEHPPRTAKGKTRYWHKSPVEFALTLIQEKLNADSGAITIPSLKARIAKGYRAFVDDALGHAIQEGDLYEFRRGKSRYVCDREPGARELMTPAQLRSLKGAVTTLQQAGRKQLTVDAVLAFMDGGEIPAPSQNGGGAALTEDLLREWYQADLPSRGGLRTMPFAKTWSRLREWSQSQGHAPNLTEFHGLLSSLARHSVVALTPHDEPARLPVEDQELLLENPDGAKLYYYTILN